VPPLSASARARLPASAFAYVDAAGRRRLPIHDAAHVRNALARFDQTVFDDDAARETARKRLLAAAKKYGIVPIGFFDGQIRNERLQAEIKGRAVDVASLPRGRVTFLMSDIESSTELLQVLGDRYARVLREIRALIRASVRDAGGHEVDARADEYFAAFKRPTQALSAAIGIQRAFGERDWPKNATVGVRIGIHTGRTTLAETGYVGIAVHTTSRVCAAGHGGQILLSAAAYRAMDVVFGDGIAFRMLGRYALAGLPDPETMYQVTAADLRARFPKLRMRRISAGG
jgi:class 3 adenylate cyclase